MANEFVPKRMGVDVASSLGDIDILTILDAKLEELRALKPDLGNLAIYVYRTSDIPEGKGCTRFSIESTLKAVELFSYTSKLTGYSRLYVAIGVENNDGAYDVVITGTSYEGTN